MNNCWQRCSPQNLTSIPGKCAPVSFTTTHTFPLVFAQCSSDSQLVSLAEEWGLLWRMSSPCLSIKGCQAHSRHLHLYGGHLDDEDDPGGHHQGKVELLLSVACGEFFDFLVITCETEECGHLVLLKTFIFTHFCWRKMKHYNPDCP